MTAIFLSRALAAIGAFAFVEAPSPMWAQSVPAATATAVPGTANDVVASPSPSPSAVATASSSMPASTAAPSVTSSATPVARAVPAVIEPGVSSSAGGAGSQASAGPVAAPGSGVPAPALVQPGISSSAGAPASVVPAAAQTPIALPALQSDPAAIRIAVASLTSSKDLSGVRSRFRFALVNALRGAFGNANVSDGPDATASVVLSTVLSQADHGYDLAIAGNDRNAGGQSFGHLRFPDTAKPVMPIARIVTLVDRTLAPAPDATEPPVIAVVPLAMPSQYRARASAITDLLVSRIGAASGATVRAISESEAGDPAAIDAIRPRVVMNGSIVATSGAFVLHVAALANGASQLDDLDLPLRNLTTLPAASAFAPFVTESIDDAPEVRPFGTAFDVAVLPFGAEPGMELAARAARTALTDRMVAAGYYARAVDVAPEGASTFAGTIAQKPDGYALTIVGRSGTSGATVAETIALAAPAQMAARAAIGTLVATTQFALGPPTNRFVYLPFPDPASNDSYVAFANTQLTAAVRDRGYAIVTDSNLDANEATLAAPQLCHDNAAQGILIANSIDHDSDYHKGALRTFGSVLGFFTAGIGEALINGVNGVASDDRYVTRANLTATLVDCNAQPAWHDTVNGENAHVGTNAGDGSGAISDAVGKLVTSLFASPKLR